MRWTSALLAFAFPWAAAAAPSAGDRLSFVSCPIVRDTGTVPCWLAEYEGEVYFLTLQTDVSAPVNPPWLGHQVLVEGVVSDEPGICGGRVIKPVALSVMPELDASCNTMLPAEDRYNLTFEPPRPPGPSRGRLAFGDPASRSASAPGGKLPQMAQRSDFHFRMSSTAWWRSVTRRYCNESSSPVAQTTPPDCGSPATALPRGFQMER